jgi:hypothetical protein
MPEGDDDSEVGSSSCSSVSASDASSRESRPWSWRGCRTSVKPGGGMAGGVCREPTIDAGIPLRARTCITAEMSFHSSKNRPQISYPTLWLLLVLGSEI